MLKQYDQTKMVGSVYSDLLGSVCSGQVGSICSGQVGSLSAEFPGIVKFNLNNQKGALKDFSISKNHFKKVFPKEHHVFETLRQLEKS